jgi:hypothetical protein
MAVVDDISSSLEDISLVLLAMSDLANLVVDVPPTGLVKPYAGILAFAVLADLAYAKLAEVDKQLIPLKHDMEAVTRAVSHA